MQAEIIAVGSELLTSQRAETNSLFLTEQLNDLGVEVATKYVVGDNQDRLADTVRRAMSRSEIIIVTGGLGPTEDDITREAVAAALDRRQVFHDEICHQLEQRFRQMNRRFAEINKRQAFIIDGAEILPNDRGTAPGQWIHESGAFIMLLPGPPHELKAMFVRHCLPRLERRVPKQVIRTRVMRVTGISESELDQLISPIYKKYDNPSTSILAAGGDLQIHLRAHCKSEAEAELLLAELASAIDLALGEKIYSRNGDPLEVVVGDLLRKNHATLAVAESCTGGMLAERITSIPGSSDYFVGGFITYTNRMKTEILGVCEPLLKEFGAVSRQVAEAMANGARRRAASNFALSITGLAGPDQGDEKAPVGAVYVGLADASSCQVTHRQFLGDRTRVRQFSCQMALDLLRRKLLSRAR